MEREDWIEHLRKAGVLPEGETPNFSEEELESLYTSAYSLYQRGKFSDAAELFGHLVLCDPFLERSWRGLAASQQMAQKYQDALRAWALSSLLKESDPLPHLHAAECLLAMGEKSDAQKALCEAEKRLSNDDVSCSLRNKIELLKQAN